jgi:hypothetical protein
MNKPEHTRPFNLEHAKAGAPYCCRDGREATVFKWDCRHDEKRLAGIAGPLDVIAAWHASGRFGDQENETTYDLVMTPLGMVDGKPVFVGDELILDGAKVRACPCNTSPEIECCTWPAPAPVYPETRMSYDEIWEEIRKAVPCQFSIGVSNAGAPYGPKDVALSIANAALRHAIDAGQVVETGPAQPFLRPYDPYTGRRRNWIDIDCDPMGVLIRHPDEPLYADAPTKEAYDQCSRALGNAERLLESLGWRSSGEVWISPDIAKLKSREMAIAVEVRDACVRAVAPIGGSRQMASALGRIDLVAVIAGIKS